MAAELARRGIDALVEPMMEVHFRSNEVLNLDGVQAVLCTSANGVRALTRVTEERDRLLLAVGDATASRARTEGFTNVASAGGSLTDLVRLAVMLRDRPGALAQLTGLVAEARANVLHIHHDRAFSRARVGETEVELTLETSGREQIEAIKRHLAQAGYVVEEVTRR